MDPNSGVDLFVYQVAALAQRRQTESAVILSIYE